jgi:hypothetical protein
MALLEPFLEEADNRWVLTEKGVLGRFLQETCGDLLLNDRHGRLWGVECKAEESFTGNLFLEEWSNRNLTDLASHAERGCNPGWLYKVRADLIFYHFLDRDALVVLNTFALKRWAFVATSKKRGERAGRIAPEQLTGRMWDFPIRPQGKYDQLNDTWGRTVPLHVLESEMEVTPRRFSVAQLTLKLLDGAA